MTNYTDAGLVTDEPGIACLFLEERDEHIIIGREECHLESIDESGWFSGWYDGGSGKVSHKEITIPWPLVKEAIEAKEGEDIIWAPLGCLDNDGVHVINSSEAEKYATILHSGMALHHRAFLIVRRCAELLALIRRCEEKNDA